LASAVKEHSDAVVVADVERREAFEAVDAVGVVVAVRRWAAAALTSLLTSSRSDWMPTSASGAATPITGRVSAQTP
jgi:hypothetical protein